MSKSKESWLKPIKNGLSVLFLFFLLFVSTDAKPKDMDWLKEVRFNPRNLYSTETNKITEVGYRTEQIDSAQKSIGDLIYRDCKYYNRIFDFNVEYANFIILNDTITRLTLLIDFSTKSSLDKLSKFIDKLKKQYSIEYLTFEDEENCGVNYSLMASIILRDDYIDIHWPIDRNETYLKIVFHFNVHIGRDLEKEKK